MVIWYWLDSAEDHLSLENGVSIPKTSPLLIHGILHLPSFIFNLPNPYRGFEERTALLPEGTSEGCTSR